MTKWLISLICLSIFNWQDARCQVQSIAGTWQFRFDPAYELPMDLLERLLTDQ